MFWFGRVKNRVFQLAGYAKFRQRTLLWGKGSISFGEKVRIGYFPSPFFFSGYSYFDARLSGSRIEIGDHTVINNNASIICRSTKIIIGRHVCIGTGFTCMDSDFHGLRVVDRDNVKAICDKPVLIADNVFIGSNVTVLKGVSLGAGCVVGSGSVVTKSFPDNSIIAGNPARLIRLIEQG